jgi:pyruvate formate lyase activating enzyme
MKLYIIKEEGMKILGLQKMTLLDFPGKIACTVFLGGCNFRCPFCHNGSVAMGEGAEVMSREEFLAFLQARRGRLEGVCVSGGEPTLLCDLPDFIRSIREMGFAVKLDTNGTRPDMLKGLIDEGLLDYVAMDIKNSPEKYEATAGLSCEEGIQNRPLIDRIAQSASLLMEGRVDFEFRTTIVRELHEAEDMDAIGRWLQGDEKFYLQTYRDEGDLLVEGFTPHSEEEKETLVNHLKKYIPRAKLR